MSSTTSTESVPSEVGQLGERAEKADDDHLANSPGGQVLELLPGSKPKIHESASKLPRTTKHVARLRADLEANGQLEPGTVLKLDGEEYIVDGVTRCNIQHERGEPWLYRVITADELDGKSVEEWILAKAMSARRSMSDDQRAMLAMQFEPSVARAAKERSKLGIAQKYTCTTRKFLADLMNVTEARIRVARALNDSEITELCDAVLAGRISLSLALKISKIKDPGRQRRAIECLDDSEKLRELLDRNRTDGLGGRIPDHLKPEFDAATKAMGRAKQLRTVAAYLRDQKANGRDQKTKVRGNRVLKGLDLEEQLEKAAELIEESVPYCVCPDCDGHRTGCKECKRSGYRTRSELRDRLRASRRSPGRS
jgi:hypothetical protein